MSFSLFTPIPFCEYKIAASKPTPIIGAITSTIGPILNPVTLSFPTRSLLKWTEEIFKPPFIPNLIWDFAGTAINTITANNISPTIFFILFSLIS
jgi:hypothetical protein